MRNTLLAIIVAMIPASAAAAEQPGSQKPDKFAAPPTLLPLKGANTSNSCSAYGAGFVKVEGTETCARIGGAVRLDTRSSSGSR
jgi:hypothetical protein